MKLTYREALESLVSMVLTPITQRKNPEAYDCAKVVKEGMKDDSSLKTVYAVCPECDDYYYGFSSPEVINPTFEHALEYCEERLHCTYSDGSDCKINVVEQDNGDVVVFNVLEWTVGKENDLAGNTYCIMKFEI